MTQDPSENWSGPGDLPSGAGAHPSEWQTHRRCSCRTKVEPTATFHILYASALAGRGVPTGVIAAQLGHVDTRMTEKHYAHLAPNYVADTVRAALPPLGVSGDTDGTVTPRRRPAWRRERNAGIGRPADKRAAHSFPRAVE
jgi:hypothetical protein